VNIRGERATDAQTIGAGLFLDDAPLSRLAATGPQQVGHELRPLNPGLDDDEPSLRIQIHNTTHTSHVQEYRSSPELLSAHRMAAASNADLLSGRGRAANDLLELADRFDSDDATDRGLIQLRVHVVDDGG
jgi:hypothetical protein